MSRSGARVVAFVSLSLLCAGFCGAALTGVSSYPNPFDSRKQTATITYTLNSNQAVTIKIYSIYGTLIKTMTFDGGGSGGAQGVNNINWDGTDDAGVKTSKGLYLAVIQSGGATLTWKIGVIH